MKIVISGYGRMGKELEKVLSNHQLYIISKETNLSFDEFTENVDIIIDFSFHDVIYSISNYLERHPFTKLIIGTTNYTQQEYSIIKNISKEHTVLMSSNYSKGMNIYFDLLELLSKYNLDNEELIINEKHHLGKLDSPSGTAKEMRKILNKNIKINSYREGDIIGEHMLEIYFKNEVLTLSHKANSRKAFVEYMNEIIDRVIDLNVGLYSLEDINIWSERKY